MYNIFFIFTEEPINVGWGKKETQFHGSAGKPTAETLKEVVSITNGTKISSKYSLLILQL